MENKEMVYVLLGKESYVTENHIKNYARNTGEKILVYHADVITLTQIGVFVSVTNKTLFIITDSLKKSEVQSHFEGIKNKPLVFDLDKDFLPKTFMKKEKDNFQEISPIEIEKERKAPQPVKVKVGDRVYGGDFGWGIIVAIGHIFFIKVVFSQKTSTSFFTPDGRVNVDCPKSLSIVDYTQPGVDFIPITI